MTFRRSLYISLFVHALMFGSAIAFAQFGTGTFWGHRDLLVVSLAGPGVYGSQNGDAQRQIGRDKHQPLLKKKGPPAVQRGTLSRKRSAREAASVPHLRNDNGLTDRNKVDTDESPVHAGGGIEASGSDAKFGIIPPDQWAIIESAIERAKSYPRIARERGIQGVVRVRFRMRPSGEVETVEIVKSSGYDILDSASVSTVYNASPMPYIDRWVEVPIAYVLK